MPSIVITIICFFFLLFTQDYFLNDLVNKIKEIRGTEHYEGETRANEFFEILKNIILPILFLISTVIVIVFMKSKKIERR